MSNVSGKGQLTNNDVNVLLDLKKNKTLLEVNCQSNKFFGTILDVLPDGQFLFILNPAEQNVTFMSIGTEKLTFIAESSGEKVQFDCIKVGIKRDDTTTIFICEVITGITVTQHRKYYRVPIPASPPCFCSGVLSDGSKFKLPIADLSVGGIGLYAENNVVFAPKKTETIVDAVVDMDDFGQYAYNLRFIREIEKNMLEKGEIISKRLLSFEFRDLDKIKKQELERLIIELQQHYAAEARRRNASVW